jgi:BirA family transcriptional regulator, biotin operon repressor / biotin---[acetyl-CoA-carboxylase] ligase
MDQQQQSQQQQSHLSPSALPCPWLYWLDSCPSTNSWALARLASLNHGDVVFTPRQTAGRGQQGRTWYAPPGVLTASFVLDQIPVTQLPGLSLAAGLAVIYAIEDLLPELQNLLRLKWSNDVLLNGRKLAGILCEGVTSSATNLTKTDPINLAKTPLAKTPLAKVVVGVGLNCHVDFAQARLDVSAIGNPVSLHEAVAHVPDGRSLLKPLRHYLLETAGLLRFSSSGLAALLPALRQRDALLGKQMTMTLPRESVLGEAAGMDDRGCLLLKLPDGTLRAFASGRALVNSDL